MNTAVAVSETAAAESRAGDVLLIPVALAAFWTLSYQLVLVARWPAATMVWCFFAIAVARLFSLVRLWGGVMRRLALGIASTRPSFSYSPSVSPADLPPFSSDDQIRTTSFTSIER